jgi:hypothetical protein
MVSTTLCPLPFVGYYKKDSEPQEKTIEKKGINQSASNANIYKGLHELKPGEKVWQKNHLISFTALWREMY